MNYKDLCCYETSKRQDKITIGEPSIRNRLESLWIFSQLGFLSSFCSSSSRLQLHAATTARFCLPLSFRWLCLQPTHLEARDLSSCSISSAVVRLTREQTASFWRDARFFSMPVNDDSNNYICHQHWFRYNFCFMIDSLQILGRP